MEEQNKKILIVEDDKDYLFILKTSFEHAGFYAVGVGSAEDALPLIDKEKPDLIVIDIMLPGMSGIEMAKKLKESGEKMPMMFLTNLGDAGHMSKALETSASDYIVKADTRIDDVVIMVKNKLSVK
jgi:DNA-binding response OmpR family regulator